MRGKIIQRAKLFKLLRFIARAVLRPATPVPENGIIRRILQKPRALDVLSLMLQRRDAKRLGKIMDSYAIDNPHYRKVQDYNASVTMGKEITHTRRAEELLRILTTLRDVTNDELLLIGPRNIHELLLAWLQGYRWRKISGIDLYSTNPKITVMNMEAMEFADESFDAICMANTLAYAKDTARCLAECVRVLRPGGRLVFGATYCPESDYPGNEVCGQTIREILQDLPVDLYFYQPTDKINALGMQQTVHLFGYGKRDAQITKFDSVHW